MIERLQNNCQHELHQKQPNFIGRHQRVSLAQILGALKVNQQETAYTSYCRLYGKA
jgi:hypothetical protein